MRLALIISALIAALAPTSAHAQGLQGRLIVGYQGWFGCPRDFGGNRAWIHWFDQIADARHLTVDMLPDVSGIPPRELCDTGLKHADGSPVYVYSAENRAVVRRQFDEMRQYGIDGVAAQRFLVDVASPAGQARADRELGNVRDAAERAGRVFFVTYDITGSDPRTVTDDVRRDWRHLVRDLHLPRSRAYLVDHGKPVLELWGFGFSDRPGEPGPVASLIGELKAGGGGVPGVTLIGGVPTGWRTLSHDSKTAIGWAGVYRSYDVISPWLVGRFASPLAADFVLRFVIEPDLFETRLLGIGYMPVIFPGFSWRNLSVYRGGRGRLNPIPRDCGRFLWRQVANLLGDHVTMIYGAMYDEVDEGTALMPTAPNAADAPIGVPTLTLDADGCRLPADWYLRVTGRAADYLRRGESPPRSLPAAMDLRP